MQFLFNVFYKQNILNTQANAEASLVEQAKINGSEYKFFYKLPILEEFAKKQYDSTMNSFNNILCNKK